MKYDLVIKQGQVVDPLNNVNGIFDLGFCEGKIACIASEISTFDAAAVIDANGLFVVPGVVDTHAHTVRNSSEGAAYKMLLRCGVTTVMDMRGPVATFLSDMKRCGAGINAACTNAIIPPRDMPADNTDPARLKACIDERLEGGAFGIKIMGGHTPFSPDTTARIIEACAARGAYVAFHCGTTATGSNINGLLEALELAGSHPLHVAHINAYCRGMVHPVLEELALATKALAAKPSVISESYLSVMNGTSCAQTSEGTIESRVTRNCLRAGAYSEDVAGLEKAIIEGYCIIYALNGGEMQLLPPKAGHARWKAFPNADCTFAVNNPITLITCATQRRCDGSFLVDALCSDGGANPRNMIVRNGLALVRAKYMTIDDFVRKSSLNPARMLGLMNKGHLTAGADGDVSVLNPLTGTVPFTITSGIVRQVHGVCFDGPGTVITQSDGVHAVRTAGLEALVPNLAQSTFRKGHPLA